MAWWQWSKTAASNATADPTVNYSEGMSPSAVNDSGRAVMARAAEFRDDTSGLLATGGTSTAYTVTSNQVLASVPNDGQLISFTPHTTNGASATLTVDSGTTYPIQTAPGTAVAAGVLIQGTPYSAKFLLASTAWVLHSFFGNPFNVPLGVVLDYTGTTAPNSNFALANGQAISRTTYAAYFALVGTAFGAGDGTTTFNIPDLSNRIVAGLQMAGTARITVAGGNFDGNTLGAAGGNQNVTLNTTQIPSHTHTTTGSDGTHSHTPSVGIQSANHTHALTGSTNTISANHNHTFSYLQAGFNVTAGAQNIITAIASTGQPNTLTTTNQSADHTHAVDTIGVGTDSVNHTHSVSISGDGAHNHTLSNTGGGASHPTMPPTMVLSKIVRIF